ncbi:MAG TPA: PRC-barrel domain-containing protein [Polyangiaceae bacterium]
MRPIQTILATSILAVSLGAPLTAVAQEDLGSQDQAAQVETMRADDLKGKKVYNESGDEVGTVDSIVRDKKTNLYAAVIATGGFLGLNEHKVTIALADLSKHGDGLLAPPGTTKQKIENTPQYNESDFDKVNGDQRVTLGSPGAKQR